MVKLNQTEQRALRKAVIEAVENALTERGYLVGRVEKGLAVGVGRTGDVVPHDFSEETFFFELSAIFKKEYDFEDEVAEYEKKLAKAEEGNKTKPSLKDVDLKQLTEEELTALTEAIEKAKSTTHKLA